MSVDIKRFVSELVKQDESVDISEVSYARNLTNVNSFPQVMHAIPMVKSIH